MGDYGYQYIAPSSSSTNYSARAEVARSCMYSQAHDPGATGQVAKPWCGPHEADGWEKGEVLGLDSAYRADGESESEAVQGPG